MTRTKFTAFLFTVAAAGTAFGIGVQAYTTMGKWSATPVGFYLNPKNADVDPALTTAAVQAAMNEWNTRSGSSFRWEYYGQVSDTTISHDGRNVIQFRDSGDGSAIATTYSWWSGSKILDSDIIFWDAPFKFFTGTSGCSGSGAYIEDIGVHELGHALGLGHSSASDATMYPSYRYCSQAMRSLASDDIAGAQALYPSSGTSTNTAPSVAISAPGPTTSVGEGTMVAFAGSAVDQQDGTLTGNLAWKSNVDGLIGTGASFSRMLSVGTHTVTASVTDSGGATSSKSVTVAVVGQTSTPPSSGPVLSVSGRKVKGLQKADLVWKGFSDATVTIYRNGASVGSTSNDGTHTDPIDQKGGGSYQYKVCGGTSGACSPTAILSF